MSIHTRTARVRVTTTATREELADWDRFVNAVALSDVAQLSAWSAVRAEAGFETLHIFVHRGDELVGGAQTFTRRVRGLGSIGYLSAGPVLADGLDDRPAVVSVLADAIAELLRTRMRALFVQPPPGADDVSNALTERGFRLSQAQTSPEASLRIDLSVDEEELRARLDTRLRRWARRWPERGVTVRLGDETDVALLAELLVKSAAYQHYEPLSLHYLRALYGNLAPTGNAVLFVGEVNDSPVAVGLYTYCGGVLRDRLIGMDRDSEATKLNVPAALKWNAILWAKAQGMQWFDFGGLNKENAEALIAGRTLDQATAGGNDFFKVRFGGEPYVLPPAVENARPMQILRLYDLAHRSERGRALVRALERRLRGGASDHIAASLTPEPHPNGRQNGAAGEQTAALKER